MKKTKFLFTLVFGALFALGLQSCNKDNDNSEQEHEEPTTTIDGELFQFDCTAYDKWHYFVFTDEGVKSVGSSMIQDKNGTENINWKNRTDWDIAFHRNDVRTNSGESGIGNGGIIGITQSSFNYKGVTEAPAEGYITDTKDSINYDLTNMMQGIIGKAYTGFTQETRNWAQLSNMYLSEWVIAKKVFVLRTADGKYAKIFLKDFLNNTSRSGYVTMQYSYQPDGTRKLN